MQRIMITGQLVARIDVVIWNTIQYQFEGKVCDRIEKQIGDNIWVPIRNITLYQAWNCISDLLEEVNG